MVGRLLMNWILCGLMLLDAAALAPALASSTERVEIFVKKGAWVAGDVIRLGRIARIEGKDRRLIAALSALELGRSPEPGKSRTLSRRNILTRVMRFAGGGTDIRLRAPDRIRIYRQYMKIERKQIASLVESYLKKHLNWPSDMMEVDEVSAGQDVVVPRGELTYRIGIPASWRRQQRIRLTVDFLVDRREVKSIWVHARLRLYKMVVVAARDLRKGIVLRNQDLKMGRRPVGRRPELYTGKISEVAGKRLRRSILSDEPIRSSDLEIIPLVKPGDMVTLVAETPLLRVTTIGLVKQEGARGDTVRVLNISSKKTLYGEVIGPKTVRVGF